MSYAPSNWYSTAFRTWRSPRLPLGLRTRVMLLLLIAVLPAIGIQAYNEFDLRQAREREIRQQVVQTTKQFGEEMGELREGARQLLVALGKLPAVRQRDGAACSELFQMLQTQYPNYAMLGAADASGRVFCSSVPGAMRGPVSDDEFFKRAISRDGLAVGNYWGDPTTGSKVLHFALRFSGADGRAGGVVFAGLGLDWLV